jgi:carboxylate-amine ligase
MCDGMPTLTEVAAVAALAQSLVHDLDVRLDRGEDLPGAREWVVRQNKWVAARHGVDAELIVDAAGTRRPARELVEALVGRLMPSARDLGCADELDYVRSIAEHGPSYVRQRRVRAGGGSVIDVVDQLVDELVTGSPTRDA